MADFTGMNRVNPINDFLSYSWGLVEEPVHNSVAAEPSTRRHESVHAH